MASFRGTLLYASHGKDQRRVDDLWSWMYIMIEMYVDSFPWKGLFTKVSVLCFIVYWRDFKIQRKQHELVFPNKHANRISLYSEWPFHSLLLFSTWLSIIIIIVEKGVILCGRKRDRPIRLAEEREGEEYINE